MTDQTKPLIVGKELTPPSTGGVEDMDDLMSGNGEHSVSINRNSKENKVLN